MKWEKTCESRTSRTVLINESTPLAFDSGIWIEGNKNGTNASTGMVTSTQTFV